MITQREVWRKVDRELRAGQVVPYKKARKIFDALYQEAVALGFRKRRFSLKDLEADIRLARALNALGTAERKARRKKR